MKNEPPYRLKQVYQAVYKNLICSWDEATSLPKGLRSKLKEQCPLNIEASFLESGDGKTTKAVITLEDGNRIEAVLMRQGGDRNTVCVSTQVGCSLACDFCASGKLGFKRNLTSEEIVKQVLLFARRLKEPGRHGVNNVVFMGIGEPFMNYDQVMEAVREINRPDGLSIGARKISISTVGVVDGIRRLAEEDIQVNLAVSLHAPDNELRDRLMPVNKKYPLGDILDAVSAYMDKTGRRVMFEYLMLRDINDSAKQAERLAALLKARVGKLFFVNLISFNPTERYRPSTEGKVNAFRGVLERNGIDVTRRHRFGRDIKAACGQLAGGPEKYR
jgi:23S rRNA (adenine2503-C2)-methyltransferase